MSSAPWGHEEEVRLSEYLVDRVCTRASGRSEDECLHNYPRDVYFIGNLRPKENNFNTSSGQPSHMRELINKLAPVALGAEFRLQPDSDKVELTIEVQWACYYRVFPTLAQQRDYQQRQTVHSNDRTETSQASEGASVEQPVLLQDEFSQEDSTIEAERERKDQLAELESPEVTESAHDRRRVRTPRDKVFPRFRKVICQATGHVTLCRNDDGGWTTNVSNLQDALDQETARAQQVTLNDPERVRTAGSIYDQIRVPEDALTSESAYNAFLQSLCIDVIPQWDWEVSSEVRSNDVTNPTDYVVSIEFVNTSPMPENAPNTEAFLFDTKATFSFAGGQVLPFELNLAPRGFRYDRNLWGRGFNCSVEQVDGPSTFTTTHTPIYRQMRYVTHTAPAAPFADLVQDPIPTLRSILGAMTDYRQVWDKARHQYINSDPNWETEFGVEFDADRQKFEAEISLFQRGFQLIRENSKVRLAFQLTNETFRRGDPHKTDWRLFQIVFLVSQIPGIAALAEANSLDGAEREMVDIIYFPTGSGKTEAYLGTLVFHCFFDRLRGKAAGVTAWTRFPLRLLTLQQTQRGADVIGVAELVRQEQTDPCLNGPDVDGFAIGYFVGQGGSPNEIANPNERRNAGPEIQVTWSQANDPDARQRWKRVVRCPACRTATVQVDFDPSKVRIIHRCTNFGCAFPEGIIPVYVVDNEVYRYLPSVIIGTIDKLAGIGNQRKLSQIFGKVDGCCIKHGYYKGKCCQKDCNDPKLLKPGVPRGLSGPTLFVQDELHLLKEGLGTFDAHYETFVQRLRREFGQTKPIKIIASSATIEAFARQVEHLYGRDRVQARIFPGLGPTLGQSFYAETLDYPQRLFSGLIPHNKTIFNTILELIEYYHREVQYLQRIPIGEPNPYGGVLLPCTGEYQNLLDLYSTSLTYFLANRWLNSIRTDLEGDVNPNLKRDSLLEIDILELTGSTSADDVMRILEQVESPTQPNTSPDAVLATSMVSHGVDVDRFNAMIFYGMPPQNAEYIQASGRVGRAHVGIVFSCLHPVRERDQSHYTYFLKFHEFLGQLVEPVAINRWSKFSIDRTLPGLFMGILLQVIANNSGESNPNRYYMLDFVKQKISEGSLRADHFVPFLEEAYRVQDASTVGEETFRGKIRLRVQQFLDQIIGAGSGSTFVSEVIIPRPMRSLRDVDEPIEIELDNTGTQWAIRVARS